MPILEAHSWELIKPIQINRSPPIGQFEIGKDKG